MNPVENDRCQSKEFRTIEAVSGVMKAFLRCICVIGIEIRDEKFRTTWIRNINVVIGG